MSSTLLHDLRYGARALRSAAGFTTVAVSTLALGIGANTAMFGVVDALLFKPPAGVVSPRDVMKVRVTVPTGDGDGNTELSSVLSYPDYVDLRTRARGFASVAAFARNALSIGEGTEARTQPSLLVTGAYFPLLGVQPTIGRLIGPGDDLENAAIPVAVLSWDFWQRSYSGDPTVVGRSMQVNGQAFTIIGVAPEHFGGTDLDAPAVWVPMGTAPMLGYDARMMRSRFASWLSIVGRLGPSASVEQAQASAQAALLAARDAGEGPPMPGEGGMGAPGGEVRIEVGGPGPGGPGNGPRRAPPPRQVRLTPLGGSGTSALPSPFGGAQPVPVSLWFLAVTGAVLLIACANVANLLLARATRREHEIAVRLSLGAPAWRLTRQLMIESLLLATLGGGAGFILAFAGVALLPRAVPLPPMPPFLDGRVLGFTAALTLVTTLAFGLFPAIRLARTDLQRVLSSTGRSRAGRSFGKNLLVVAQLAASLVLVIGAGLFIRSLRNVRAVNTGFAAEQVMFASLEGRARFTREQAAEYWQRALERVRSLPGVRSASLGAVIPFEMNIMMPVDVPGYRSPDGRPTPAQIDFAGTDYFSTLGIAVKQGRAFTVEDREGSAPVVIVNEALARRAWGGASPIGRCVRIGMPSGDGPCMEVVGVAADARYADVTQPSPPFVYRPLAQRPRMGPPMTIMHVRASGDPTAITGLVRRELQALDASVPFVRVVPMMDLIAPQLAPWRTGTFMFTLFGALGLALAAIGLYGVISFVVAQRTREMGVRIALGARRGDVLALVLVQGGRLIASGIAIGAAIAAASTRLFGSMMYGVSPLDPVVYVGTAVLLGAVGVVAMIVPARRATRVDPLVALRAD